MKVKPISKINNQSARITQKMVVQPFTETGIRRMKKWLIEEEWQSVLEANTANEKAILFQNLLEAKYNEYFPKKTINVSSDDQPWFNQNLKKLDRPRKRIYSKNRRSEKWQKIDEQF